MVARTRSLPVVVAAMSLLLANGFEDALLGIGQQFDKSMAVYDRDKCLQILVERDGMTPEEAEDYFEFNVVGAWVGEYTPIFMIRMTLDDIEEFVSDEV